MIQDILQEILHIFTHYCIEISPYFAFSILCASLADILISPTFFVTKFQKVWRSILHAPLLGAAIPACSCTSMPIADSLKRQSNNIGAVMAFILVSPALGPHSIILTASMLGWKFTWFRILSAVVLAGVGGGIYAVYGKNKSETVKDWGQKKSCCKPTEKRTVLGSVVSMTKTLAPYFLLGLLIASVIEVLIPASLFSDGLNDLGVWRYIIMACLAIPIYVCAGEEIPITLSLLSLGLTKGAAFTFMMASVGTCIPTMLMAKKLIGTRYTVIYVGLWFIYSIVSGMVFEWL